MRSYIEQELPEIVAANFPADMNRQGITGHSMGGHGALTVSLRNPGRFRSTSAFAPIVSPLNCPWGEKALTGYLGPDRAAWREYDAVALIEDGARVPELLVDQGTADNFLEDQLKPNLLDRACRAADIPAEIRMQEGYDHSYYFISTFMAEHVAWHAERMKFCLAWKNSSRSSPITRAAKGRCCRSYTRCRPNSAAWTKKPRRFSPRR